MNPTAKDRPVTCFPSISTVTTWAAGLLAAALFSAAPVAVAQEGLLSGGGDGGIEIEADDGIEWLRDQRQYRAYGNATARRGDVTVVADALIAHYREEGGSQIVYRLDAEGGVILTSNQSEASGDKAVYHLDRKVAVLVGEDLQLVTDRGTITAEESLEYWEERGIAVARGDALVTQQDRRLKAGVLTAFIEPGEEGGQTRVTRIDATGGVHISTPTDIVTGGEGVYIVAEERVTVCGDVKITRDQNQLNGECAVVDMLSGRSTLQGKDGEKVQGLILRTE
jgi:lipopolysaccharide export system protein LptA